MTEAQVVEGVLKGVGRRKGAVTKSRVVGGNDMVIVTESAEHVTVHVRRSGETVQQDHGEFLWVAGFAEKRCRHLPRSRIRSARSRTLRLTGEQAVKGRSTERVGCGSSVSWVYLSGFRFELGSSVLVIAQKTDQSVFCAANKKTRSSPSRIEQALDRTTGGSDGPAVVLNRRL